MAVRAVCELFETAGYPITDLPVLLLADTVLDLTGEEIRRRLFLTQNETGVEYCMRPDFTIPVAEYHLAGGDPDRRASYAYCGPVFRHRPGQAGEFWQAGIETIGRGDREASDAEVFSLAIEATLAGGLAKPIVRIGDAAIFSAVADELDLADGWRRRLKRLFGDTGRVIACLNEIAEGRVGSDGPSFHSGVLAALDGRDHEGARAIVEDLLSMADISAVGGRTPAEIADRFLEKASLAAGTGIGETRVAILRHLLELHAPASKALDELRELSHDVGLNLSGVLDSFEKRMDAMDKREIDVSTIEFSGDFGRRIDYYTGFVFEIHDAAARRHEPIAGGGRYDRLLEFLGAAGQVPAVGAAIYLERLPGVGS